MLVTTHMYVLLLLYMCIGMYWYKGQNLSKENFY